MGKRRKCCLSVFSPFPTMFSRRLFLRVVKSQDLKADNAFKYRLNIDKPSPNKLYFFGDRKTHIIRARLRNKCSRLNEHLYLKYIVQSPFCICGSVESTFHYFFECPFYRELRTSLNKDISSVTRVTLHVILYGDEDLHQSDNEKIFAAVHTNISQSRRFT